MKKKYLFMIIAVILLGQNSIAQIDTPSKTVTDVDGNVYHTVTIGTQTWLVENLKTTKYNDGTAIPNVTDDLVWRNLTTDAYCIYKNSAANNTKYGKLYNWYAVNTGKLAPKGWHVPTNDEWSTLNSYVSTHSGVSGTVGKALASNTIWSDYAFTATIGNDKKKNNSTGFSAMPGGVRTGNFIVIGMFGGWWTSTVNGNNAYSKNLSWNAGTLNDEISVKAAGLSVRCIKGDIETEKDINSASVASESVYEKGTFTDSRDGKIYKTVKIGTQIWMAENLNFKTEKSWYYDNKNSIGNMYGRLYSWKVAKEACPSGWHLPSKEEWEKLTNYVGGSQNTFGGKLKSISGWDAPNEGATNETGFSALPGGYRSISTYFIGFGGSCRFWSSTEYGEYQAGVLAINNINSSLTWYINISKDEGVSIRCIKD